MNFIALDDKQAPKRTKINRLIWQGGLLSFATVISIASGFALSVINTHFLETTDYGRYKLLGSLFALFTTITSAGLFVSSGRLVSIQTTDDAKRRLIGASTVAGTLVAVGYTVLLISFSFLQGGLVSNNLPQTIFPLLPLLLFMPLSMLLENLLQGDNKMVELSIRRSAPIIIQILLTILYVQFADFSSDAAILFQLLPICVLVAFFLWRLRPSFAGLSENLKIIWAEARRYGFFVYIGSLANVATLQLAPLLIAFYLGDKEVGFFLLALGIAGPLAVVPTSFGSASFKNFANQARIPKNEIAVTVLITISLVVFFNAFIGTLISHVYPSAFTLITPFVWVLAIGSAFRGLGDYLNRFLGAHGRGKDMRNAAFLNGFVNVAGYAFVVPIAGLWGAVFTKSASDFVYASAMYLYYRGEQKRATH